MLPHRVIKTGQYVASTPARSPSLGPQEAEKAGGRRDTHSLPEVAGAFNHTEPEPREGQCTVRAASPSACALLLHAALCQELALRIPSLPDPWKAQATILHLVCSRRISCNPLLQVTGENQASRRLKSWKDRREAAQLKTMADRSCPCCLPMMTALRNRRQPCWLPMMSALRKSSLPLGQSGGAWPRWRTQAKCQHFAKLGPVAISQPN